MTEIEWTDAERSCCFGTCGGTVSQHAPHEDQGCAMFEDMLRYLAPHVAAREARAAAKAEERATDEYDALLTLQSDLLEATVNVLRGDPPELTQWSHHDVAERAQRLKAERDRLAAKVARVEALLAEYERMCQPAPWTSERAFVERLRAALEGDRRARPDASTRRTRDRHPGPARRSPTSPNEKTPDHPTCDPTRRDPED